MKSPSRLVSLAALLALAMVGCACTGVPGLFVVRSLGQQQEQGFNATSYVNSVWSSKVVPTFDRNAIPIETLISAIKQDPAAASQKYGHQESLGGPYSFMVKGTGKALAVDRTSAMGLMSVDLQPYDGEPDLFITVGPAFLGTAIRDAVGFIHFSQFTNQLDYADVATALNTRVRTSVINAAAIDSAPGQTVAFEGAFTLLDPQHITVTPVRLRVGP